jgi:invasion protein IalB
MLKKLTFITFLSIFSSQLFAETINKPFGRWLVSCKTNMMTAKNECFIGTTFNDDNGRGAIIFTKYYLAVSHNESNLSQGIDFNIDQKSKISSYMNTGINVFFKNNDRKELVKQMQAGKYLNINIKNLSKSIKPLEGFKQAYQFYLSKIN